eukprot:2266414-Prymnesium_polylepis.1
MHLFPWTCPHVPSSKTSHPCLRADCATSRRLSERVEANDRLVTTPILRDTSQRRHLTAKVIESQELEGEGCGDGDLGSALHADAELEW